MERDFQTILCCDPRVEAYAVQPHQLTYWTPGQGAFVKRIYTPDFVLKMRTGQVIVVEVKAHYLAQRSYWRSREPHIRSAYRNDYAVAFVVVTEHQVRSQPRLANLQEMLRYGGRLSDPAADMAVRDALASSYRPTIGEVCEAARQSNSISRSYAALMRLALSGEIVLDLSVPLSAASKILIGGQPDN